MKNRVISLLAALALCFALAGCSGLELVQPQSSKSLPSQESAAPEATQAPAETPVPTPEEPVDLSMDIVQYAAGIPQDTVMLTINGDEIHADLFLYLLFNTYTNFQNYYYYYTGSMLPDISLYANELVEDTITSLRYYTTLRQKAESLGCGPTQEQLEEMRTNLREDPGTYTYEQQKQLYGLTDEGMEFISSLTYYYENMLPNIPMPTAEELNQYVYQTKHILLSTVDTTTMQPLDEDTIAEKRQTAEDLLARLQAVEGEEREALFNELMEEYSEDGRDTEGHIDTNGYEAVLGTMVSAYEEASLALPIGGLSGIVESDYGYHIILRGPVEFRDGTQEEYASEYQEYLLDQQTAEDAQDASMEPVRSDALNNLDLPTFFDRFTHYIQTLIAEFDTAATPAPTEAVTE